MKIKDRIIHAWNAFTEDNRGMHDFGRASGRPIHKSSSPFKPSSYVSSIYNRIAMDVSMTNIRHVVVNPENDDEVNFDSRLNECLSVEANIDQTHIQFVQDLVYSMFDEGVVAIVPVDTTISPSKTGGFDITSMRVGKIINWFPKHVEIELYNENTGNSEQVRLEKKFVAIIENPLFAVVNDANSTLQRLVKKLQQMDDVDELASSSRLDVMISVPYSIKTNKQREMAEQRIKDIEAQLSSGKNGIAYIDGTEKVQQMNRPVNSQLPESVQVLKQEFYNQLGLTENIFNGTAKEEEMRAYYTRTIDPIIDGIVAELNRKFLTKTARTRGHKITYYRDMFKMVPLESIATLGDTFRRNAIGTSNELRKIVGWRPSDDPRADELFNPNIADDKQDPGGVQRVLDSPGQREAKAEQRSIERKQQRDQEEEELLKDKTHMTRKEREALIKETRKQKREGN